MLISVPHPVRRLWWLIILLVWGALLTPQCHSQFLLSEFQASNARTLKDEDGDSTDWIELSNPTTATQNLAGWYLSDDASNLKKWQFPPTNLPPGDFLIIYASEKNRRSSGRPLHTNFKLSSGGEFLALVNPDGSSLATVYAPAYPPQVDDLSYGLPLSSRLASLLPPSAPGRMLVPANGDFDSRWMQPDFKDLEWVPIQCPVGFDFRGSIVLAPVADSVGDWSTDGVQGAHGWEYGYCIRPPTPDPGYQASDFVPFPRTNSGYGPLNFWTGSQYRWPSTAAPWDLLGQTDTAPTGTNSGAEHWAIRRWRSPGRGLMQASWTLSKTLAGGGGVTGRLFVNGVLKDFGSIAGDDFTGLQRTAQLGEIQPGDIVDLAVTPAGPAGDLDDANDTASSSLTIKRFDSLTNLLATDIASRLYGTNPAAYTRFPFLLTDPQSITDLKLLMRYNDGFVVFLNGVEVARRNAPVQTAGGTIADSANDWSPVGQQGFNNWYYGYYEPALDPDHAYAIEDFSSTAGDWQWNGDAWVRGAGDPPWERISLGGWQPNGANSGGIHWPVRRWISTTSGPATCGVSFAKENVACGGGATLRVFQNGAEQLAWPIAFGDGSGLQTNLWLNLEPGDYLDFALDPSGPGGAQDDLCDACTFRAVIQQSASPGAVWNSTANVARPPLHSANPEEFDLAASIPLLVPGTNWLAVQGLNVAPNSEDFLLAPELRATVWSMDPGKQAYFTLPTPGKPNDPGLASIGPSISEVTHFPAIPRDDQDILVRARITATLRPSQSVVLKYRVMYASEFPLVMYDDGQHDDGLAGDNLYATLISATNFHAGQMVRYTISASDTAGQTTRLPLYRSSVRSPQYFGTVVYDPVVTNSTLPILHWFISVPSAADSDTTTRCSVFFDGEFYDNIGVNLHGQSTRSFPKKSYDFDFNPGYKLRWSHNAPRVGDINLLTTWADKTHMRTVLAYETYSDSGAPAHFALPVRVHQNRAFFSVANLVESGDDDFLERVGLDPKGALYKMYNSAESVSEAEKKTRKNENTADLQALINGLSQPNGSSRRNFLYDNLDLPEMVNFLAAKIVTADIDCCFKNYYLYRDSDRTGEWQAMPWDTDLSFGRVWTCNTPCYAYFDEKLYTTQSLLVGSGNVVFTPIYDTPATRQMFFRRLRTLMDRFLQPPGTAVASDFYRNKTTALRDRIAPDAARDLARWGTWGTRETITQAVNRIWNEFLPARRTFVYQTMSTGNGGEFPDAQPENPSLRIAAFEYRSPAANPLQDWLSLTNPNSYAVDISGWELTGGIRFQFKPGTVIPSRSLLFVSPSVRAFRSRASSPKGGEQRLVVGPYDGILSARGETVLLQNEHGTLVHSNGYPSAPSPAQSNLRITEIFYNPDPAPSLPSIDPQSFEFIELKNIGAATLSLAGVRFTAGVQFDFTTAAITTLAPGARLLLVADTNAFAQRYGPALPVAGQFTGRLDNSGERLRLDDAFGEPILDFSYDNRWFPVTDGHGFSLAIVDDLAPWDSWALKSSWQPNGARGGSPGQPNSVLAPVAPVQVNEVLAHAASPQLDGIELYNPTSTSVDVGNWFLSDDFGTPGKFRIPNPTVITPGGYVFFSELQFDRVNGSFPGFGISAAGDDVWLFSADALTNLTGYVDGFEFGATPAGASIGRYTNSVGEVDLPLFSPPSLGAANGRPILGPIVISEIMYHPPDTAAGASLSFIELSNLEATNCPLFNPAEPTNSWRLWNTVDFTFPANTVLPPGGTLLVVGFDPLREPAALDQFQHYYGLSADVPVYGPWDGGLANSGGVIDLESPDRTRSDGLVPYVRAERVHYADAPPWPVSADGGGASLQRRVLSEYGNEPTNWFASAPTPAAPNYTNQPPQITLLSPLASGVYEFPTNLPFLASASDPDGRLRSVEFHVDGSKIAELLSAPFEFYWTNVPAGTHTVFARATDDRGTTSDTAPQNVVVRPYPTGILLRQPLNGTVVLTGATLTVTAEILDHGSGVDRVEFRVAGQPFALLYAPPYESVLFSTQPASLPIDAVVVDIWGRAITSRTARVAFTLGTNAPATLVAAGSSWRYLDDGSNQGTAWTQPAFSDSGWKSGNAELGYGDSAENRPERTVLKFGASSAQKYITYYFRQPFVIGQPAEYTGLNLSLLRDDGAVVYLNGKEFLRSNMPLDGINYLSLASAAVSGVEETTWYPAALDRSLLSPGTNWVAVEVHQSSADSSDLSFDLSLSGTRTLLFPAILSQPDSQSLPTGATAVFAILAGGTPPLAYQWWKDGAPVPGAIGSSLWLANVSSAAAGVYHVVVTNNAGSVVSASASLTVTNTPPLPGIDGLLVPRNASATIQTTSLLANDLDPEAGTLTLTAITNPSQAGGRVSLSGNEVQYSPPPDFVGNDLFSYTVSDPAGSTAHGSVEVLVYSGSMPDVNALAISLNPPGYVVRYRGAPGGTCQLQRSSDLLHWQTVLESPVPPHGCLEFQAPDLPSAPVFYRTQLR